MENSKSLEPPSTSTNENGAKKHDSRSPSASPRRRSASPKRKRSRSASHSRSLSPSRASPPYKSTRFGTDDERKTTASLYVGNIPNYYRDGEVRDLFEQYGKVANLALGMNKVGVAYAFVEFHTRSDAEEALRKTDGQVLGERFKLRVDWDIGKDKKRDRRRPRYTPRSPPRYGGGGGGYDRYRGGDPYRDSYESRYRDYGGGGYDRYRGDSAYYNSAYGGGDRYERRYRDYSPRRRSSRSRSRSRSPRSRRY